MFPLDIPVDPLSFSAWEQVVALLIIVAGGIVWRYLGTMKAAQKATGDTVDQIKDTLIHPNGGGSVKDALNRLEETQAANSKKLNDHLKWSEGYVKETAAIIEAIDVRGTRYEKEPNRQ